MLSKLCVNGQGGAEDSQDRCGKCIQNGASAPRRQMVTRNEVEGWSLHRYFGLRSAPKIYTAVADALQWILMRVGIELIHYLDD